ncbi:Uncharacterized [Moorella glycerini]|nr:hypothetical protein [Moorella glycerini]CEP68744.1 Uncharacterized [Moorella glycerini]
MARIVRFGNVGEIIDRLTSKFAKGEIQGILVCVANKDGTFEVGWTDTLSYIERLGLLEAGKGDCYYKALCAYCE